MTTFRHSAGFGKRIEHYIIGLMLKEGLDVYLPIVDDDAIDAIIKRSDGSFTAIQIKARSTATAMKEAALFAAIPHELRKNYWFIFYSEQLDSIWIMTSKEFIAEAYQNKNGKNAGKRSLNFCGTKKGVLYCKERYEKYLAKDFSRLTEVKE